VKVVKQDGVTSWAWWFKSVISATQEIEIRRITIQGQQRQKDNKTHLQLITLAWWYTPVILATW
jgi:hypothetical protein